MTTLISVALVICAVSAILDFFASISCAMQKREVVNGIGSMRGFFRRLFSRKQINEMKMLDYK